MASQVSTRAFRDFVPEIREMIYAFCLRDPEYDYDWTRKTPALLAALRGESELYTEALHYYYANNTTVIHQQNFQRFEALNSASWASIGRLEISLPYWTQPEFSKLLEDENSKLRLAESVKTFSIDIVEDGQYFIRACDLIARCAWNSTRLQSVEVIDDRSLYNQDRVNLIDGINSGFVNARGKLKKVSTEISLEDWIWKAENNAVLELSQEWRLRGAK